MTENVKLLGENAGVLLKCVSGRMRNFESRIGWRMERKNDSHQWKMLAFLEICAAEAAVGGQKWGGSHQWEVQGMRENTVKFVERRLTDGKF